MSIKILSEIDCNEETQQDLYTVSYRDLKLKGSVVDNTDLTSIKPHKITPNTVSSSLMRRVCK